MKGRRPTSDREATLMLEIFRGCINTGTIPHPASRCAEILGRLIREGRRREAATLCRRRKRQRPAV